MKVKLIGGGPMNRKVFNVPDSITPEILVHEPVKDIFLQDYPARSTSIPVRIGRYSSLQPGIDGGPKRLVWQGYR